MAAALLIKSARVRALMRHGGALLHFAHRYHCVHLSLTALILYYISPRLRYRLRSPLLFSPINQRGLCIICARRLRQPYIKNGKKENNTLGARIIFQP
jgi:hypothetical protein